MRNILKNLKTPLIIIIPLSDVLISPVNYFKTNPNDINKIIKSNIIALSLK